MKLFFLLGCGNKKLRDIISKCLQFVVLIVLYKAHRLMFLELDALGLLSFITTVKRNSLPLRSVFCLIFSLRINKKQSAQFTINYKHKMAVQKAMRPF